MSQLMKSMIGGVLLAFASTAAIAAGAGQTTPDTGKAESGEMKSGASSGATTSSGASGNDPSRAEEPTGAPGTAGRSGATTSKDPNDVVDKPKGMDQPAGSVPSDQNTAR